MPYDLSKDYTGISDGNGGVRLVPKPHLSHALDNFYRTRTTDALPTPNLRAANRLVTRNVNTLPDCEDDGLTEDARRIRQRLARDQGPAVLGPLASGAAQAVTSGLNELSEAGPDRETGGIDDADGIGRIRRRTAGGRDQLPPRPLKPAPRGTDQSPTGAIKSGTAALSRLSNLGEAVNKDQGTAPGEKVLGVLPPCEEGMTYILRDDPDGDGSVAVVCVPDDGNGMEGVNSGDNRHAWSDSKFRAVIKNMNKAARSHYTKDQAADQETTLMVFYPGKSQSLVLKRDPRFEGKWIVCLVSRTTNIFGDIPDGGENLTAPANSSELDEPRQAPGGPRTGLPNPGQRRTGDSAPMTITRMNAIHKAYWSRGKAA